MSDLPLSCPKCGGQLYLASYDPPLKLLRNRSWHCCRRCSYSRSADDFKKGLLCV